MSDLQVLSNIFWHNKIKFKEKSVFSKEAVKSLEREILKEDLESFLKISKNNFLSKFTIVSSVFSFVVNKYFENYQNVIKIYPSHLIDLENFLLLEIDNKATTFKELLQSAAIEVKEALSHKDYDSGELKITSFSNFSIQYGEKAESLDDDFSLLYREIEDGILLTIFYKENYPDYVVESLLKNFINILSDYENLLNKDKKDYSFVDESERQQLLVEFNDTKADYPNDKTIVQLFEEQVENTPGNIAVVFEDKELTYQELNEKVNQLVHYIKDKHAIENGQVIATLLPKSIELLISLLAIEKLGCVYLPIDINYPKDRIDYILEDSNAKILLSEREVIQILNIEHPYTSLQAEEIQLASKNNSNTEIKPNDVAYLIYTSGSTGKPKGVLVEHHSNINMSLDQIKTFGITSEDRIIWFASVAFDASISEVMMGLYSGARLCIPTEEEQKDQNKFVLFLKKTGATVVTFPPSYLEILSIEEVKTLKQIITAGESANPIKAKEIVENGIHYYNAYGPTEYSVCTSIFKLNAQDRYVTVPIGKPIANTEVYVLDDDLSVVPLGVAGTLYISGAGLSRGYLNRPELTGEKFIENPFNPGTKMYDTGDLVRWLPDGNVEFLGRKDFQVKIRGYRIELGEIETNISLFSTAIKQVVVDAKEIKGEKILAAYYTKDNKFNINKTDLREYLQSKLPEYMVPGLFVELDSIPLTPNGKIDRKALRDVTAEDLIRREYVAPRNTTEEKLAEIWQEVLGIEKVGIIDHFFELGGHSLMVAQVVNRIHQNLSMQISFKDFFVSPTIEGITKHLTGKEYIPIPKAPEQDSYPLTPSQQRLWILSQLEGGSQAYNMLAVVTLRGELNKEYFEKAFQDLVDRHEILRTSFKSDKETGEIRQHITPKEELHFTVDELDFTGKSDAEVEDYLQAANKEAFNLENSPLIRASLLRRGNNEENLFFLSIHHIIGDGWSTEVLISEVVENYNRLQKEGNPINPSRDREKALPLSIQYKDYALWLQDEIKGEKYQKSEAYWVEQFEGELPVLELPSYKTRPLIQTYNGDNLSHLFSKEFTEKLKKYSEEHGATLFMTLMAGVKALLYRYTGQQDIIIGTPIAGREHPDLENQIGLYLNTLAVRTKLEEHNTFESILTKEKETLLSAYEHQLYPFDELVGKLNLKRDTSRSALFDVLVVLQNQNQLQLGNAQNNIEGLQVEGYDYHRKTSQFDVSYTFVEEGKQLGLTIEYNTDIYDEHLIQRMFAHFENLLTKIIEDKAETVIEDIDYLTDAEHRQLLVEFNDTTADSSIDKTIIQLFEEQVEKTPENVAVVFEGTELTYRMLNEQANQLGAYLRQNHHIQPDDLVAIKLGRSEKMILAILGVLKSGAAYVPIDPEYPQERIEYIEQDTHAKATIDEAFLEKYEEELQRAENLYTKENLSLITRPESLAYVIYTSGTTGQPKGVMIENRSLSSYVLGFTAYFKIQCTDVILSQATIAFDTSIEEIFPILIAGGKLVVVLMNKDFENLVHVCKKEGVTRLSTNPYVIEYFNLNSDYLDQLKLTTLISGGDKLQPNQINRLLDKVDIYNTYGPTESTVCCSYYKVAKELNTIPIGQPISNTRIYILDDSLKVVPIGVSGKLYVSGTGLSRGYLNKPELTSEKFVTNPFHPGTKMYDTGDLGRWLPDGNIEFLGRKDFQVKIRGYRIELGEIETSISQFSSSITQVVADVKEVNGEKVLAAYYTKGSEAPIDKTELRGYLQSKLPEYMVPGFFVELDFIPLTSNGKIARKALPGVTGDDLIRKEYVAPRNSIEEKLAEIWQEVLGVEKVGITDNFFELGGHSIKAMKMLNEINLRFDAALTIRVFFQKVTIEQQAELIAETTQAPLLDDLDYIEL